MYHKQVNKTAVQSQNMIADALFSLMKRKHFQQITVTEICDEAAIGRKTFYRNFDMKEDVLIAFTEAGIEIPFPQLDVHMDSMQ